ncbi:putative ABC transport system permease protein [Clostridium cavendishii DSM 21758]|uniref:Putative ABC transport system permease protein n=1 Tax=Clostridium cavendishii DSM 21758 TaxID=1121302 RepID=A0A1M6F9U9_9CLOT|nr:FtsX-like permease family protein [Clostridium cavendishii]SHI94452.1 putative ABC transport system permease protein [Clostridium cavendishii DSM 21758]
MYARLAINNAKKSVRDYVIYFVTLTLSVSLFYAFMSLSSSSYELITEDTFNFDFLKEILKYSSFIITAVLTFLISYVNRYMIRRRQKEFATYILLGTEQKSVALMFFVESLIMGIISIIIGVFIGTLFSQVVKSIIFMTIDKEIVFSFKLYMDTIGITFAFFVAMFCIIGLFNIKYLRKIKLIDMLNAERKSEFQFKRSKKVYIIAFIISILAYITFIYCINTLVDFSKNPSDISGDPRVYAGIAVVNFILGIYTFFYSISYVVILIKNKCTNFKYEYTNLFLIGGIVSKIKTTPILMGTIALTFLGAALSFVLTVSMAQYALGYLNYRVPFDITISNNYSQMSNIGDVPKVDYSEIIQKLKSEDYGLKDYCQEEFYLLNDKASKSNESLNSKILVIRLSDFNKLREMLGYEKIILNDNEYTTQWQNNVLQQDIDKYINENQYIAIKDKKVKSSSKAYYKDAMGDWIYNRAKGLIILPDKYCEYLNLVSTSFFANISKKISYNNGMDFEKNYIPQWFEKNYGTIIKKNYEKTDYFVHTRIKSVEHSEILNATLGMRIVGIYLGTVLLMISLTVLALQELSDSIEHKGRFKTLNKLGIDNKEINKIILKQISLYFILPMLIAIMNFPVFIYNFFKYMETGIMLYVGDKAFVFSVILSLSIIVVLYMIYFIATYCMFKNNVKECLNHNKNIS